MKLSTMVSAGLAMFAASQVFSAPIDVIAFKDTFDTKTAGTSINGLAPEIGQTWYGDANSPVSNAQAQSSPNSLLQARTGGGFSAMGLSDAVSGMAQPNRTYTLTMDLYTPTNDDSFYVTVRNNGDFNKQHTVLAGGGVWRYYDPTAAAYINTGVNHTGGQWNSIELEVRNGAETSPGVYSATMELFLTEPVGGTRISVVSWTQSNVPSGGVYGIELGPQGVSTVYYDNMLFGYQVPEPASLSLLGLGALALRRRK